MSAVRVEKNGFVTTVILNRPQARNAVDGPTADALANAFTEFEYDDDARVAVLWGEGGHFCAGADLKEMSNRIEPDTNEGPMGPTRYRLNKPVIAAVSGYAVAGGLELALWCDLRVVEEDATFGVFCRRWGVPLIDGGTFRLPMLIGMSRALDLILTGRPVTAQEALAFGLANRVVPSGAARQEAEKLAATLAQFPQACMRSDRMSALKTFGRPQLEAVQIEFALGLETINSGETVAGAERFAKGAGRHGKFED